MKIGKIALSAALLAMLGTFTYGDTVIYSESFSGDGTSGMDGATTTTGGGTWDARSDFINNDGTINGGGANGAWAGSALLAIAPELNKTYTLSMDMYHTGNDLTNLKYLGLGFTRDGINEGVLPTSNRIPNLNGSAWFQYGHGGTVVTYGGLSTANEIANTATYVGNAWVNLKVIIDTTGDGSSFTADFLMNDTSIVGGAQTIALAVDDLNYAAIGSYGTNGGDSPVGSFVDNFSLTVIPEPATLGLVTAFGGAVLFIRRRFMI